MLRLTRELINRGFDSREELLDLLMQIDLMETYATLQGRRIEKEMAQNLAQLSDLVKQPPDQDKSAERLKAIDDASVVKALELAFEVHGGLSEIVKPATPESLEASAPRKGWARVLWPRVTDTLIVTTFLAVVACAAGFGLKTQATGQNAVAFQELAYLGAALLGASFSGLFTAYKYVQSRTFDPAAGSSYMVRVVLGTVSGIILANIGFLIIGRASGDQGGSQASVPPILASLGPGTLALVGGYSADAVNMILQRIADTLVTTVRGNSDDAIKAKQTQLEAESKAADFQQRQATVVALSEMLKNAADPTLKNSIQTLMAQVGQGSVGDNILKPTQANGNGVLDMTGGPIKPADPTAAKADEVAQVQSPNLNSAQPAVPPAGNLDPAQPAVPMGENVVSEAAKEDQQH